MDRQILHDQHKRRLLAEIDHLRDDLSRLKRDVENGMYEGLGGALQNSWKVYYHLGALADIEESSADNTTTENL